MSSGKNLTIGSLLLMGLSTLLWAVWQGIIAPLIVEHLKTQLPPPAPLEATRPAGEPARKEVRSDSPGASSTDVERSVQPPRTLVRPNPERIIPDRKGRSLDDDD